MTRVHNRSKTAIRVSTEVHADPADVVNTQRRELEDPSYEFKPFYSIKKLVGLPVNARHSFVCKVVSLGAA